MTGSAGQKRVPSSFIEQYYIGLPPLAEQIAIAEYLDKQTAQIDDLVTQKWKLISLLQEERAGIINDAVTQGLNHRAPRKESGLPWLGKIPAHWGVKKLKYVANVRTGIALGGATDKTFKVEMPYIRVANVQDGYLNLDSIKTLEIEPDSIERYSLKYGDLLMNEGGDNDKLGRGCVWRGEVVGCLHQNHVFAVRMKVDYNSEWVNAVTLTNYARHYFMTRCKCPYPFR
jgi:type I restriction enzyme S subunit